MKTETPVLTAIVNSTAIPQVAYNRATRELDVWFTSGHGPYTHPGVPEYEFLNLINADSPGTYYRQHIKRQYTWDAFFTESAGTNETTNRTNT